MLKYRRCECFLSVNFSMIFLTFERFHDFATSELALLEVVTAREIMACVDGRILPVFFICGQMQESQLWGANKVLASSRRYREITLKKVDRNGV
mmetsp:Transcript_6801/g.8873  ORF Transcript_6801/g.8873 Transcript_6801/m.8873 type:complete len:94 (+) Transcript_6801:1533-1814(+)